MKGDRRGAIANQSARLIRLGGDYERAKIAKDWELVFELEKTMNNLNAELTDWNVPALLCRGRNIIRRNRGLGEVAPF